MKDNRLLTVCIPCYNAQNTIGRCIESILNQTYPLSILIVNDGSKDNSGQAIDEYASKYDNITVIHQENAGIAKTRNVLLANVETPYFGFLDADDQALPTYSDVFIPLLEKSPQMAVANFNWITSKDKKVYHDGPYDYGEDMVVHLFSTLWNKVYNKAFITSIGLTFPNGNRYEDSYFLYCLAPFLTNVSFSETCVIDYIQTEGSITHTNNQQVKHMIEIFKGIVSWYKEKGIYDRYKQELEYLHIKFFLGNSFLRSTRIDDASDRKATLKLGWDLLNESYPHWHKNPYLKSEPGLKNKYFRFVYSWNYMFFANLFRFIYKDKI